GHEHRLARPDPGARRRRARCRAARRARGRGGGAAAHLRDHLAPRRREDHAHREAAALRRGDPPGGEREGAPRAAPRDERLDEARAGARDLRDVERAAVRLRRDEGEPARHAGPRRLLRGHLPHAHRRRQRGDAARQPQGRRGAHAAAVRGVPQAAHAGVHLREQVRPPGDGPAAAARRRRARPGHHLHAGDLADLRRRPVRGRLRPPHAARAAVRARRGARLAAARDDRGGARRARGPRARERVRARQAARGPRAARRGDRRVRRGGVPRRHAVADVLRVGAHQLRGRALPARVRAARAGPHGARHHRGRDRPRRGAVRGVRVQDPGEHGRAAPRPHGVRARGIGALRGGDGGGARAHRQDDPPLRAAERDGARAAGDRRGVRRRRGGDRRPRGAAHRRHAVRGRDQGGAELPRHPALPARALRPRARRRPDAPQAARHGAQAALRGGRGAGVLRRRGRARGARPRADRGRGGAAAVRRDGAPPRARVRRPRQARADRLLAPALGDRPQAGDRAGRERARADAALRHQGQPAHPLRRQVDAPLGARA
ncbi:MAG: Peptide chain release factor 3, partial [uncultured Gemmatimonadaceae bacterium]